MGKKAAFRMLITYLERLHISLGKCGSVVIVAWGKWDDSAMNSSDSP